MFEAINVVSKDYFINPSSFIQEKMLDMEE